MKNQFIKSIGLATFFFVSTLSLSSCNKKFPYQDTSLSPANRAKDIVSRLTLEEKVALMQHESPAIPRLGIKKYVWWNEALHGVARAGKATVFPQAIGMAASFNDSLLYDVFTAVSDEARAKHTKFKEAGELNIYQGLTFWTPNVNIFRDPRWGRGQETYGEDPYLTSRMGISVVRGLQGPENEKYDKLHACAKHFAVHSGPEGLRHSFNAENIAPRDLWETYLPAFKALVQKADVKEVMCAYNRFEGEPCCGSNRLLQQILRDEWKFDGIVLSDCWAINDFFTKGAHETEPDSAHASSKAVIAGTDLECGASYSSLVQAVKDGLINEKVIDRSVERLMTARFELGEMDKNTPWDRIPYSVVNSKQHQMLAMKMAQESLVLLQNKNRILPIGKNKTIAVVGPNACDSVMQWGNYNGYPGRTITLLDGIKNFIPNSQIIYEKGCDLVSWMSLQSLFHQCSYQGKKGFKASYWNKKNSDGNPDVITQVTTPFQFATTGATTFAPGVNLYDFTAVYETTFIPTHSEQVIFSIQTRGDAYLYINDKEVATAFSEKYNHAYKLEAKAGEKYDIRIKFSAIEDIGSALSFNFGYERPTDFAQSIQRVKDADIIIFAGGISPQLEGEEQYISYPGFNNGDRTAIELPSVQTHFLAELKKTGKPIVFVNFSGSAIALERESQLCDAIIQAWYPGEAGGQAIASVLFGAYNPAGRLPVTFYKSTKQLPDFEDYSMKGRTYRYMTEQALFPFGHGLSYTTFTYGDAQLSSNNKQKGTPLSLCIPITNSGEYDGEEVVQIYLRRPDDKEGPTLTLRAFERINIKKGETKNIIIKLNDEDLEWFDTTTNTMRPLSGTYEILYGGTSDIKQLKVTRFTYSE